MYNIPLFDLNYGEEEERAVVDTLRSKWISTGPRCSDLEEKFSRMFEIKYACALTNCTAALHLACCALGIKEGDEVICPSLTFAATANCIRYVGGTPVFADICGDGDLCIDPDEIDRLITSKTRAVIPMHFGGFPCDMDLIMCKARKYGIHVIEDACHGPLSEYSGRKLGTLGDIGCFSFFSNKNLSTGEGGMLITDNEELYNKVKLMRSHGMTTLSYQRASGHATKYDIVDIGYNYRMDDIRASLGIVQLDKLRPDIEKRAIVRSWYIRELGDVNSILIPFRDRTEYASNYIFPIILKDSDGAKRDVIRRRLQEKGIQTSVHYPALHRFSAFKEFYRPLPKTEFVTDRELTLPMYASLTEDQIVYICDSLKGAL